MSYCILLESGIPVSITTIQRVTYLETCTDANKQRFKVYYKATKERLNKIYTKESFAGPNSTNPTTEMWDELVEDE